MHCKGSLNHTCTGRGSCLPMRPNWSAMLQAGKHMSVEPAARPARKLHFGAAGENSSAELLIEAVSSFSSMLAWKSYLQ